MNPTPTSGVSARILKDVEYPKWNKFVAASSTGSVYSTPEYLDILCGATGGTFQIAAVLKGDEILGGIAIYQEASRFGTFVSDRRLLYYNGLVLRDYDTKYPSIRTSKHLEIAGELERFVASLGLASVRIKSRGAFADPRLWIDRGWSASPAFTYVVPTVDLKQQWERVEQNLRRLVDRCADHNINITSDDDFDSFYNMHAQTHERKGAPIYLPKPQFLQYFRRLSAIHFCKLFHARTPDGRSIAAQLVLLGPHPVSHTVGAGADPEFLKIGASAFVRWKTFEALSALGYKANDLTDASLNPVTHFKSQFGGTLEMCWVLSSAESAKFRAGRFITNTLSRLKR
ncbi:MAG: GNAT family N-acetyltransferase [Planctomycetota bacterium]